jgi:hypothetical protein
LKKLIVLLAIALLLPVLAFADQKNTGCGLGTLIIKDANSVFLQTLVVTTNASTYTQTFGITSGTSNCSKSKFVQNDKLNYFVDSNMDVIAHDIAKGEGESLNTIADLMNIDIEKRSDFFLTLQKNFSNIYTSDKIQAAEVIDNINMFILS